MMKQSYSTLPAAAKFWRFISQCEHKFDLISKEPVLYSLVPPLNTGFSHSRLCFDLKVLPQDWCGSL